MFDRQSDQALACLVSRNYVVALCFINDSNPMILISSLKSQDARLQQRFNVFGIVEVT